VGRILHAPLHHTLKKKQRENKEVTRRVYETKGKAEGVGGKNSGGVTQSMPKSAG